MRQYRTLLVAIGAVFVLACEPEESDGPEPGNTPPVTVGPNLGLSCDQLEKSPDEVFPLADGVATLAGDGEAGSEDGCRGAARFFNPVNVALGPDGNLYVADFDNGLLRRVTPEGDVTTVVDRPDFVAPFGLAFTPSGVLFVETDGNDAGQRDYDTGTIWRVDVGSGEARIVARNIGRPRGLAALDDEHLVLVDNRRHTLSVMDLRTREVHPLAGRAGEAGYADGAGAEALFHTPYHVVLQSDGSLLVADKGNHVIRRVDGQGNVTTWAGTGRQGSTNGARDDASFDAPQALALGPDGTLYVTDTQGYRIRAIDRGGSVFSIAGDGSAGWRDGDPKSARFSGLEGIAVSPDGNFLYIADGDRGRRTDEFHRIRRLDLTF